MEKVGRSPRVMVMGALGRCGTGAKDFALKAGIPDADIIQWDMQETAAGGPFPEILKHDIFVNCIYLSKPIPPFLTKDMLDEERRMSVICDVSCDGTFNFFLVSFSNHPSVIATNPHNPIPVYFGATTFDDPLIKVATAKGVVDVIAIDHLPTLLQREASDMFARYLLPTLLALPKRNDSSVWKDAETLFNEKVQTLASL